MSYGETTSEVIEEVASAVVDSAFAVHQAFGPGLLESMYKRAMVYELRKRGLLVAVEVEVPVYYDGVDLGEPLRLDLLVGGLVIVEIKSTERDHEIHKAQTLTYLRLSNLRLGLLINFNVRYIKDGIKRIIN